MAQCVAVAAWSRAVAAMPRLAERAWGVRHIVSARQCPAADGVPVWLSVDGEVAAVEPGFTQAKRPHGLLVYRPAGNPAVGMTPAAPLWLRKLCSDALHVVRTSVLARLAHRGTAPDPAASAGGPDRPLATAISR